jgi:uncharacterized protein YjbI with pentapeptide repeats
LIKSGAAAFNEWRRKNLDAAVDLSGADLAGVSLSGMNLYKANLRGTRLVPGSPIPFEEDLSGDPSGAMNAFMEEAKSPIGDRITILHVERGEYDSHYSLPTPFIVHCTREPAANLSGTRLEEADLREADLSHALMRGANLCGAKLDSASLRYVDLSGASLDRASLAGANVEGTRLTAASLVGANLRNAQATAADFQRADLSRADLSGATLRRADLRAVNAPEAKLSGADLRNADLRRAQLDRCSIENARLQEANLELANLVEASVEGADVTNCRAYGVSAWGLLGETLPGMGLVITRRDEPVVTTDSLRVAQFVHLLLSDSGIREVIDTVTSKVVLILGRFTKERKFVLDALRRELRRHDLTPVLFDFDIPADRDITETVTLLARMARFIIADLTDPSSIPMELQAIAPDVAVPICSVVQKDQMPFSMFGTLKKYHWVLPPYRYSDTDELLGNLQGGIIAPAEAKRIELKESQP